MDGEAAATVAVGEITGFGRVLNPFSKKARIFVNIDGKAITVHVDYRQIDYFRRKFASGSRVAVGFYGGEWHLGSPPAPPRDYSADRDIGDIDLLQREMEDFDLIGLVGKPADELPAEWQKPALPQKEAVIEDFDAYNEYLRRVESNIKDNGSEILTNIGLGHLAPKAMPEPHKKTKKHNWASNLDDRLDTIIAQNNEIMANQDEIMRLLRTNHTHSRPSGRSKSRFN